MLLALTPFLENQTDVDTYEIGDKYLFHGGNATLHNVL